MPDLIRVDFQSVISDVRQPKTQGRFVREVEHPIHITAPEIAAEYLMQSIFHPFRDFDQEEMWVLLLNTKNQITHETLIYRGTVNTALVRVAEIFKPAVWLNSPAIIASHNHPSGDPTPSPEDVHITRSIREAGQILGIEVLDHILIGNNVWISLKERGVSGFE
ncbi:MAG: hypothetical protein KDJ52_17150 [Anaerolineae bacterium]|nr:hypothetical protein [Anaerolineae bacterium]MCB0211069.1 hypothetical protein [Anaerolineae bacterium]